jgi:hypothetical protein
MSEAKSAANRMTESLPTYFLFRSIDARLIESVNSATMTDSSLKSLFDSAERQRLAIESSWSSNTQSYQQDVASTIKIYEDCCKLRDSLSLFSPNEILEDVNSGDLQYVSLAHWQTVTDLLSRYMVLECRIAELYLKLASDDRKLVLHNARKGYESFLALLDQYEMLSQPNKKLYADYLDSPTAFSTISTTDPNARRGAKIANFKLEKELKKQLEVRRLPDFFVSVVAFGKAWGGLLTMLVLSTKSSLHSKRRGCSTRARTCTAGFVHS